MAIIPTITKKSVSKLADNLFNITVNMVLTDDTVEVLNKDYFIRFRKGDTVNNKINQFVSKMQADIDSYKEKMAIYNSAQLDMAVTTVQETLEV